MNRGGAAAAGHGEQSGHIRAEAGIGHGARFVKRHMQQLVAVEHHHIALAHKAQFFGFDGAGGHFGHGQIHVAVFQGRQQIALAGARGLQCEIFGAAAGRNQAHAHFHKADIALKRGHHFVAVHHKFAAAAECKALHGRHGGDLAVAQIH